MDEVKLKVFGKLEELMGAKELVWSLPIDVNSLRNELESKFPSLKNNQFSISINNKIVSTNVLLRHEDQIALLPPFSGG